MKIKLDGSLILNVFVSVMVTFGVGAVFSKYFGGLPLTVNSTVTQKASTFDVQGEGKVRVVPDEATLTLGVFETGQDLKDLQDLVSRRMDDLSKRLKALGVEEDDIKTQNYQIYPQYDFEGRRAVGYQISTEVEVRIRDFAILPQVLALSGELGLNQVGGVSFGLSEEAREKALGTARELAVAKAKEKAKSLSSAAGLRTGKIVNVYEYENTSVPGYGPVELKVDAGGTGGGLESPAPIPQVSPGLTEVVLNVTLSYETL